MTYLSEIRDGKQIKRAVNSPDFTKEFDVIVCGLGTAGSLAALYCAENGLFVLGIEAFTAVGGIHTVGGVPSHYFDGVGGRYRKPDQEVAVFADRYTHTRSESRKFVAEQSLLKEGVTLLYESKVCGIFLEESTVIGVRVFSEGRFWDYKAKIVMDCTAEAHVAVMAGCETEFGRESDGKMQPYSLVSILFNGEKYRYNNIDFGRVNQFDENDLSRAILFARSFQIPESKKKGTIIAQMPLLGIREGRRILAEETAHVQDLFAERPTETPMFYSYADLDKHGWDIAFDGDVMGDWAIGANLGAYNVTVAVPYKGLLPKGFDGILVPCRALGIDRDLSSCVRMIPDMKKAAESAAEWASLSVKQEKPLRKVAYEDLKERLEKSNCLHKDDNRGFRVDGRKNYDGSPLIPRDVTWIEDASALAEVLKTQSPGEAIWSAKRMGKKALEALRPLLYSKEEALRKHAAFAVAAAGSEESADLLREMAKERDGVMLLDCRKNNQLRGCMAIYWLGRLGDRGITEELIRLICDENEIENKVYHQTELKTTRYRIADFNDIYFQFTSQALMALVRIGNRHADLRAPISDAFEKAFFDESYYRRITSRPRESSEGDMVLSIKTIAMRTVESWKNQ